MRTLRVWFCCLTFAALGSAGDLAYQAKARIPDTERYTVVLTGDQRYSRIAILEMEREASAILKRSGINLHMQIGNHAEVFEGSLVVVNLRGRCDMEEEPTVAENGPLGWTHSVNGTVLPFATLACGRIREVVLSAPVSLDAPQRNAILGRAMGRVLAHELYHIAGETSKHGREGVAQAALTPGELTSNHLELDPVDAQTIQNQLGTR